MKNSILVLALLATFATSVNAEDLDRKETVFKNVTLDATVGVEGRNAFARLEILPTVAQYEGVYFGGEIQVHTVSLVNATYAVYTPAVAGIPAIPAVASNPGTPGTAGTPAYTTIVTPDSQSQTRIGYNVVAHKCFSLGCGYVLGGLEVANPASAVYLNTGAGFQLPLVAGWIADARVQSSRDAQTSYSVGFSRLF